ncbi:aspartate aminotransferase family protein [Candidimonas humi]|uniref:Aspartate aminotransferase family protein n=1 Tax=Candidimonas humi TaxID=683355 RepID=A0ABV8P120_9BURK|nr:aspartate aminotransferase family protein [Candidimonas humi]MBV6305664.1 aspartate aminotransferase family protein [Candidimonas humi]
MPSSSPTQIDPEAYWMPFTANRRYKRDPVLFDSADGMYYHRPDGSKVLDGIAGLWCVNAGHRRPEVVQAIAHCADRLDYASSFQMSHPLAFQFAEALCEQAPGELSHVFFSNSGSEAVDTALKIALGYHKARGQGQRVRLIGRERSYHGVGFGGLSVSGIGGHRKNFGNLLPYVDYLPHTYDRSQMAYTRGQPAWGAHLADELERIVALHDASTIAAVIVEPVAGSTGVLVPPQGYLRRLREICDRHGILLIFDEVICAFGRLGAPFASERFGVLPDIVTCAKGLTNGAIPMGATLVRDAVYEAYMDAPEGAIEFSHGYTYSGHPVACAAGLATLAIHQSEGLAQRARELEPYWEDAAHALCGLPGVVDIRNIGLLAAVELEPRAGKPGQRGFGVHQACLAKGSLIRSSGDAMLLSPPLIIEKAQIDELFSTLSEVLRQDA